MTNLVYEKINAVMGDLSKIGIAKSGINSQQGFNFRGIDQIYAALSPVLSSHGLMCLPRVLSRTSETRQTSAGKNIYYVFVSVEYDIVATDGSKHTVCVTAEAMDSADKATNKALSAAFKYMALQVFCIPVEGQDDADADVIEHAPSASEFLMKAAFDVAARGVKAYSAFWAGIQPSDRLAIGAKRHDDLKAIATSADKLAAENDAKKE